MIDVFGVIEASSSSISLSKKNTDMQKVIRIPHKDFGKRERGRCRCHHVSQHPWLIMWQEKLCPLVKRQMIVLERRRPGYGTLEAFNKYSFKVNRNKILIYADVVTEFVFARYVVIVDQVLQYSPYGMTREERGKGSYMLQDAKRIMEKMEDATDNEALFKAQNELRGVCAAVVEAGLKVVEGNKEV